MVLLAAKANPFRSGPAMLRSARADGWFPRVRDIARKLLQQHFVDVAKRVRRGELNLIPADLVDAWEREWVFEMQQLMARMVEEGFIDTRNEFGAEDMGKSFVDRMVRGKQSELELPDTGINVLFQEPQIGTEALTVSEAATVDPEFLIRADFSRIQKHIDAVASGVTKRSSKVIQAVFNRSADRGDTPSKIARELTKQGAARSAPRARMIARTETIWAYNEGAEQRYSSMGVQAKEWVVTNDDLLCPWCEPMDGIIVAVGGPFFGEGESHIVIDKKGKERKLDIAIEVAHPPLHPNCRCTLVPVI